MADSAKQVAESIPAWDGNPRGWRRYSREVLWYVLGTKKSNRAFLAPRLIAKLTGSARLLAMSWSQADFRGPDGVKTLLKRLAASPLVRKALPNTSAVLNQYFGYRRFQGENIANYLVRETLYYEEFCESLMILKEETEGGMVADVFNFSDSSSSEDEDGDEEESTKSKKDTKKSPKSEGYKRVPADDPAEPPDSPHGSRPRSASFFSSSFPSSSGPGSSSHSSPSSGQPA